MGRTFLRAYKSFDLEEVRSSLLIVGEVTANCAKCGEMGLDPKQVGVCPNCNAAFKYLASRRIDSNPNERFQYAARMANERPDLTLIDLTDFQKTNSSAKARDLLGGS